MPRLGRVAQELDERAVRHATVSVAVEQLDQPAHVDGVEAAEPDLAHRVLKLAPVEVAVSVAVERADKCCSSSVAQPVAM